ncbi:hypothetical protein [Bosea sp. FBZP-16]|uniref:hypothetical protein n=1 Tax=Bosea sp. FBZP-16 TaxID=2065382 RepID=UPI000C317FB9|nr:hypothetical protein [Bosea sp. FBZP-16]
MARFFASRRAPTDAAPLMAILARNELAEVEAERERLKAVIASIAPRRSTIIEGRLKRLTRKALELQVAIKRSSR